jgi:hypothetical protein
MNLAKAINLLVAAKEDPVLAAWAFMLVELKATPGPDGVSPYDAWDAYQQLYDLGLIDHSAFHRTDPERAFFARSAQPAWGAVESVLHAFHAISHEEPPVMSKIGNPFEQSEAIVTRDAARAPAIPAPRSSAPLSPFGGQAAAPLGNPFSTSVRPIEAPASNPFGGLGATMPAKTGLPCNSPNGSTSSQFYEPEVYCCRKRVEMANDGGQVIGPDDLPGNQVSVVDAIFHGICPECNAVLHMSVGKINHDARR